MTNRHGAAVQAGAQTITWGETIRDHMPAILEHLAADGYRGVETGVRHFDLSRPDHYRELYARCGLQPVALHAGGSFWDRARAEAELADLAPALDFAARVGFRFLTLSGDGKATVDTMPRAAAGYNRLGAQCRQRGLQLAYHNHDWELARGGALYRALLEQTDPDLVRLVPDVAWVHRAGVDPVELVREQRDRLAYLHFKDTLPGRFAELGTGEVDLAGLVALLPELPVEWVVVEQDATTLTPERCLQENARWLHAQGLL